MLWAAYVLWAWAGAPSLGAAPARGIGTGTIVGVAVAAVIVVLFRLYVDSTCCRAAESAAAARGRADAAA